MYHFIYLYIQQNINYYYMQCTSLNAYVKIIATASEVQNTAFHGKTDFYTKLRTLHCLAASVYDV